MFKYRAAAVILILIVAWCSAFHHFSSVDARKEVRPMVWKAFSVQTNWDRLTSRESAEDAIPCIHGLRAYTMLLVVLGHRAEALTAGPVLNGRAIEEMYEGVMNAMVMNGHFIVDTSFTISGFLMCWNLLRALDRGCCPSLKTLYLWRYIRLTPAYMATIAIQAFVLYDLSSGPLWSSRVGRERDNCLRNWWTNALYINNYVHPEKPCIDPSWYIACDTQLFLVAPFFVHLLYKRKKIGIITLGVAFMMSIVVPAVITYSGNLDPTIIPNPSILGHTASDATYVSTYVTAYCRAGPYFLGMLFAYWLFNMKKYNQPFPKVVLWLGWTLCPALSLTVIAAGYAFYQPDVILSKMQVALYAGLHRPAYSLGIGFLITACAIGRSGPVNSILSWHPLRLLSRLTYCLLLCHSVVQMFDYGAIRAPVFLSHHRLVWLTIGDIVISMMLALLLYLTVESPALVLCQMFLRRSTVITQKHHQQ